MEQIRLAGTPFLGVYTANTLLGQYSIGRSFIPVLLYWGLGQFLLLAHCLVLSVFLQLLDQSHCPLVQLSLGCLAFISLSLLLFKMKAVHNKLPVYFQYAISAAAAAASTTCVPICLWRPFEDNVCLSFSLHTMCVMSLCCQICIQWKNDSNDFVSYRLYSSNLGGTIPDNI